jgi:hypothetical protein
MTYRARSPRSRRCDGELLAHAAVALSQGMFGASKIRQSLQGRWPFAQAFSAAWLLGHLDYGDRTRGLWQSSSASLAIATVAMSS